MDLLRELVSRARVGVPAPRAALAVVADALQESGEPLGAALAAALADPDLEPLGIDTFACPNDTEGERRFDVPVFVFVPFARAIGLAAGERAPDTELVLLPPPGESGTFRMGGEYLRSPDVEAPPATVTVEPYLILSATSPCSASASHTSPKPPAPRRARSQYGPSACPGSRPLMWQERRWQPSAGLRRLRLAGGGTLGSTQSPSLPVSLSSG